MCEFWSAIVTPDGKVHSGRESDRHEDIIERLKLPDDTADRKKLKFARIEIIPPNGDVFADIKNWDFRIDERITPTWWNDKFEKKCFATLKRYLKTHVLVDQTIKEIRAGRVWLKDCKVGRISGDAKVHSVSGDAKVHSVYGNAKVDSVYGNAKVAKPQHKAIVIYADGTIVVSKDAGYKIKRV